MPRFYVWRYPTELICYLTSLQGRSHIFKIHARSMSVERDIRYELLARLCPNTTGQSSTLMVGFKCQSPQENCTLPQFSALVQNTCCFFVTVISENSLSCRL